MNRLDVGVIALLLCVFLLGFLFASMVSNISPSNSSPSEIIGKAFCESNSGIFNRIFSNYDTCKIAQNDRILIKKICYDLDCKYSAKDLNSKAYWVE